MILYSGYNGIGLLMDSQFWNLGSPISLWQSLVSIKILTLLLFSPFFKFSFWMHWRSLGELQWWLMLMTLEHALISVYRVWQSCEKYTWEGFSGESGKLASLNLALPLCATHWLGTIRWCLVLQFYFWRVFTHIWPLLYFGPKYSAWRFYKDSREKILIRGEIYEGIVIRKF